MIGTVLNNTYRLEKALTEGGMGQVFIASHLRIKGRKYAIKQLRPELAAAPNFQTRFQVEAEVMMELDHPHIVRIEDFLVQDNSYYLVMEFVEGHTLDGHLSLHGALATDEVHRLAIELLAGLEYCHQKGVIHRDLKPSNLLLTQDDVLKLTDFGIALQENTDKRLTRTGTILGTPDYMSPEQIMSYPLDGRSDIYSAGIILYEMSAGLPPFLRSHDTGGSYQILFAHVHRPPPDLDQAKIPAYLREAIERSIKKDPSERFASAQQMIDFLQEARARDGFAPIVMPSNGAAHRPTPSLSAAVFVPGQQPVEPKPIGSQDAISAASNEQIAAASLKETTPTPSNLDTSSLAKIAVTPIAPRRRWPLFLCMAFLAGVSAMLAWWMIEPESFAQLQQWVEQKTGLKAPIPTYTKRIANTREPIVLTPRRRSSERPTHTERRIPGPRSPLLRTPPTHPRRDTIPPTVDTPPRRPQQRPVVRQPALRRTAPPVRDVTGSSPWPFPLLHPHRRGASISPHLRRPITRRQPLVRRPVVPRPHARRDLPPPKPQVDLPLWGYNPTQRRTPEPRTLPLRPRPIRPLPIRPEPIRPEPIRPEPIRPKPIRPEPVRPLPLKPDSDRPEPTRVRPLPVRPEPVRPEPVRPEPTRPKPARPEPIRPEPIRPEPIRPKPIRPEPVRPLPLKPDSDRPEPIRPEPIRRIPLQRHPVQRPLPTRRMPLVRKNPSGWPLPISSQCRKLLQMCVDACLRQRNRATRTFHRHCRSECWRTRIVQYKQQKICPPDPPEPREPAPNDASSPPPSRRITL